MKQIAPIEFLPYCKFVHEFDRCELIDVLKMDHINNLVRAKSINNITFDKLKLFVNLNYRFKEYLVYADNDEKNILTNFLETEDYKKLSKRNKIKITNRIKSI